MAGRARTLFERIEGPPNVPGEGPSIPPGQLLQEWRDLYPDEDAFRARLDAEGLSETDVREAVTATRWPDDEPLPDWVDTVDALVEHVQSGRPDDANVVTDRAEVPFAELLAAVAEFARDRLPAETVPDEALPPAVDWLVSRLEMVSVRPLYVEFKSFVDHFDPDLATADPDAFDDPPTELYEQFLGAVFDDGFENVCLEYPVLSRFLAQVIDSWMVAVTEVSRRIEADRPALRSRFGIEGPVTELEPLSTDTHADGRVPFRVTFETGEAIYKPRPVDAGIAFYTVLDRLNDYLPTPSFETPAFLSREGYGWMEPVEFEQAADEAAVDRYYERAGATLCVGYVLGFTDCQHENLIVDGEHPVIVDGETLFHPWLDADGDPNGTVMTHVVDRSVLLTGLLPWDVGDPRKTDERGMAYMAGFGASGEQVALENQFVPDVEAVNTDVMSIEPEAATVSPEDNTPSVDGEVHPPAGHVDALVRGFEGAHREIRRLHESGQFLEDVAPPELVEGVQNRFVYRSTMEYAVLRRSAVARNPLRDGARLSVEFEDLATPLVDGDGAAPDRFWRIYEAERRALRRFDVPRLTSSPRERTLYHDGESLGVGVDESGYDRVRHRLDAMDATDRLRQTWLIRQVVDPPPSTTPPAASTGADLQAAAGDLFETAFEARIETTDGPEWLSICKSPRTINFVPADPTLFWGRGGLALAATALYEVTGDDRYRRSLETAIEPVVDAADGDASVGLGGTKGIGSVVYTLSVAGDLLDEDAYRRAATDACRAVTDDLLAGDDTFDVMEGTAGTLLGLLACYERFGDPDVLDRAVACGERLLDARVDHDGHRVWYTVDHGRPVTGVSHGTTGIAYALARLADVTGDGRYEDAVRETLAFEATLFDPSRTNWADSTRQQAYQDRWCHGRTGMSLARIEIGDRLGDDALVAESAERLRATARADPDPLDNLCCGNAGRAEALLVASRRAGGDVDPAHELAGRILARRDGEGALSLPGHGAEFVNPTFFDGVSGVAYTLSRLRDPDALPSVLLLE